MSDHHKFGTHLPRSGKEFLLFVLVMRGHHRRIDVRVRPAVAQPA